MLTAQLDENWEKERRMGMVIRKREKEGIRVILRTEKVDKYGNLIDTCDR
jgi:hypothetical protein